MCAAKAWMTGRLSREAARQFCEPRARRAPARKQLEQALKKFPERFAIEPLRVIGATKETAQVGAASAAGIQLKTAELVGLREIPVNRLPALG